MFLNCSLAVYINGPCFAFFCIIQNCDSPNLKHFMHERATNPAATKKNSAVPPMVMAIV